MWEINEAFAAQVLGCLAAWRDEAYCQEHFGTPAWGQLDTDRLNIDGGAIAIGHPVGASGARIVLHLLDALKRRRTARHGRLHWRRPRRRHAGRNPGGARMSRNAASTRTTETAR